MQCPSLNLLVLNFSILVMIVKAYNRVEEVVKELQAVWTEESVLHSWYSQAESLASKVDVVPQITRTASRQQHRENIVNIAQLRNNIVDPLSFLC